MKKLILSLILVSGLFADTFIISQEVLEGKHSRLVITKLCQDTKVLTIVRPDGYDSITMIQNLEQYDDGNVELERCQRDFKDSSQFPKD